MRPTPPILLEALYHYLVGRLPNRLFRLAMRTGAGPGIPRWLIYTSGHCAGLEQISVFDCGILGRHGKVHIHTHHQLENRREFEIDLKDANSCDVIADFINTH